MNDLKNILRDVGYFGIGAAAALVEAGSKAVKGLVRKGEKTLRDNQDTVDDLKRKARELGDKMKDAAQKAAARPEEESRPVDASAMSPEERAELRRQLDEADAACETDAVCGTDAACEEDCVCEESCTCETDAVCEDESAARPVAPDVIYHTDAPVSEEDDKPEETING